MVSLRQLSPGVFVPQLFVSESIQHCRHQFDDSIIRAQCLAGAFARRHQWGDLLEKPFVERLEIYDRKEMFDRRIRQLCPGGPPGEIPVTFSAGLEKKILFCVTPGLYHQNYPDGREADSYVKMLTHEIIHRLHVRILQGDEQAMGPIWFFEGFAIHGSGQFTRSRPRLSQERIREIVQSTHRSSYVEYASVFEFLLKLAPLRELVQRAGHPTFSRWVLEKGGLD